MLLNGIQHERQEMNMKIDAQQAAAQALVDRNAEQAAEINDLKRQMAEMRAGLLQLQTKGELVAAR